VMGKWRVLLTAVLLAWSAGSRADLTLSGYSVVGAFGVPLSSQEQIWIRNTSLRRDFMERGRAYTQLFDLARKQAVIIDHFTRVAELHDLNAPVATTEASMPAGGLKLKFEPTGNARPLLEWSCREFEVAASMPARLGSEETVFHLNGKVWVASGVEEEAAVKGLVSEAKKPGFFLGIPSVARVTPAQSLLMNEIIRKLATKGLPCAGELESSYEGNGPMVNLARKMPSKVSVTFQKYSTEPIKPEMFMVPAGYQQVQRQLPAMPVQ
jgi:hypothetical protein